MPLPQGARIVEKLNLQPLMDRLGIRGVRAHEYHPDVIPVAVIDGSITATTLQTLDVPFTAGETAAPAANTRLALGPALPAGQWNVFVWLAWTQDTNRFRLRRRNAGDTADIWSQMISGSAVGEVDTTLGLRVLVAANEFFVVENTIAGVAGSIYQASLWFQGPF
jgi:hypothetical protein